MGAGTLIINGTNNLALLMHVSTGTLQLGANAVFARTNTYQVDNGAFLDLNGRSVTMADIDLNGGTIETGAGTAFISSNGASVTITSSSNNASSSLISGNLDLGGRTVDFAVDDGGVANDFIVSAIISNGALNKILNNGDGVLVLSGNNTYAGATTNDAGTLQIGDGGATGTLGSGAVVNNAALAVNRSGAITISNNISGTGTFTNYGSGPLTLSGANTYAGDTTLDGGTTVVTGSISNNATLFVGREGGGSLTVAESGTVVASNIVIAAVNGSSGTLNIGRFGTNDTAGAIVAPTIAFGSFFGSGTGAINFNQSDRMTLSAIISGGGELNQLGTGTTELSGSSTSYTGPTMVSAGTLLVNGSIANSAVTVNNGGTLGGDGKVGVLTILDGGTVSPGNSPGNLGVVGDVIWNGGGNYNWQIHNTALGQGIGWDLITISGEGNNLDLSALSLGSKFNLNLWSLDGTFPDSDGDAINFDNTQSYTWTILTGGSAISGFSADYFNINVGATNGTAGFANNLGGGAFSLLTAGNNLNLIFTPGGGPAVPEPGTWAAAALLAGGAAFARWRRRRSAADDLRG